MANRINENIIAKYILVGIFSLCLVNGYSKIDSDSSRFNPVIKKAYQYLRKDKIDSSLTYLNSIKSEYFLKFSKTDFFYYNFIYAKSHYLMDQAESAYNYALKSKAYENSCNDLDLNIISELDFILGWTRYKANMMDSAQIYNLKALNFCSKNDSLKACILKSLGNIHLKLKNYDEALNYYHQSLSTELKKVEPDEIQIAGLFQNEAIIFVLTGNQDSAKIYFTKSLQLKEHNQTISKQNLANGYLNFSIFLRRSGDLTEALDYINKAEKLLTLEEENYEKLASVYINKGAVLILLNHYEEALNYNDLALELYKKLPRTNSEKFSQLYLNIGLIYENLENYQEAINYYELNLKNESNKERIVKAYRFLANCYANIEKPREAERYFKKAISTAKEFLGISNFQTALCYLRYGEFCTEKENYTSAIEYLNKSLELHESLFGMKNRDVSNVLTIIGNYYDAIHQYDMALQYYQNALISFFDSYNDTDIYHNPEFEILEPDLNLFITLYFKAFSFYSNSKVTGNLNDLKTSLNTAELAIALYEDIKSTLNTENTKLLLTTRVNQIYNLAVMASAEMYRLTGNNEFIEISFNYSEKSKAAVLLSSIREMEAIQIGMIPAKIRNKEKDLKNEISQYIRLIREEKISERSDSVKLAKWQLKLHELRLKYDSLITYLETNFPDYYNLKYNNEVITIGDVQRQLSENEIFVEYKLVDTLLFSFFILPDSSYLKQTRLPENFTNEVARFVSMMNSFPQVTNVKQTCKDYATLGYKLYDILLDSFIRLNPSKSHLIIIPDDVLDYLSFDALVYDTSGNIIPDFRNMNYLLKKATISYGNSATLFYNKTKNDNYSGEKVLAMAPSYSNANQNNNIADTKLRDLSKYLTPLVYTQQEVDQISQTFEGLYLKGNKATETAFKKHAGDFQILHFAMHTLINDENPSDSKLVFSLGGDSANDGLLNTNEIYNLNLHAKLAVLSACKTGVGKLSKGEGIMSLARGFFYAGVPGIVMTLWAIEDVSSAEIITTFYKNLKTGMKKDDALREAKLTYLHNANQLQSHPYFWAAYVQIGDNSPLEASFNYSSLLFSAGIALILIIIITIVVKRRLF